jgi:hypothetical protein
MKMEEVRTIAKAHSVKPERLSKADLIKRIQVDEGNFDCYATAKNGECDQLNCIWREDCFAAATKGE